MSVNAVNLKSRKTPLFRQRGFRLFLMILPFAVITFLLSYLPLSGWALAFFNYKPGVALTWERFVGFDNFKALIIDKYTLEDILRVLRNTFGMSFLNILISPLPMLFAIFFNEIKLKPYKKVVQTMTTIPNFISWVLVYSIAYAMFSVSDGFINRLLIQLGVISDGINFLASPDHTWLKMLLWTIWKSLGWNSIMYVAAMSSIDQELYEAAHVDGAGRFACIRRITIPGLMPTYFVLLILSIGNFINNGMEQYYVFQNAMNKSSIEVLDLYVYNQGILSNHYSYSVAISMLKSLVSIVLLFAANSSSKLIRKESVF